jgi:hypothetical protein
MILLQASAMLPMALRIPIIRTSAAAVSLAVVLVLLSLAPFAAALGIHHELAVADQDGHQHSDTDLCQWVQHHTTGTDQVAVPAVESLLLPESHQFPVPSRLISAGLFAPTSSRAPPLS